MFVLPTVGLSKGYVRLDVLCDWIESSLIFVDQELSDGEVFDILNDEDRFKDQDATWQAVLDAWVELRRRSNWLGASSPIRFIGRRIELDGNWQDSPAQSFCIALALAKWHPEWAKPFNKAHGFNEQGRLFEELTKEAMQKHFPDWMIVTTGWSRATPNKLAEVVKDVATRLGEAQGSLSLWTSPQANEAGLDILCYRPFRDGRIAVPVYLMQCGSGSNWDEKLDTPNLRIWGRVIEFVAEPKKAFSMPFALLDEEFIRSSNLVNGLFLDRYRLLSVGQIESDWVSERLRIDIIHWLGPRIAALPRY